MTLSEKYVAELCEKSFMPFWSFPNPLGKNGKELCDVLIVCGDHIIIISVKDIRISQHKDASVVYDRWVKKAVDDSAEQIFGAERFLSTVNEVSLKNRKSKIKLPEKGVRKIYRVAIAFGSPDEFPLPMGFFEKGFVHVFDEQSTFIVLSELDTITDFTDYLTAKEEFLSKHHILVPREVDFLALYIDTALDLDIPDDSVISSDGLWRAYSQSEEYEKWQKDIVVSRIWDFMIQQMHKIHITDETADSRRWELEEAIRTINLESRMNRMVLGETLDDAIKKKVLARITKPLSGATHAYVLMPLNDKNWQEKEGELELRCIVARYENPEVRRIIGVSIGSNSKGDSCFDIFMVDVAELDETFITTAKRIKKELGYFNNPVVSINNGKA